MASSRANMRNVKSENEEILGGRRLGGVKNILVGNNPMAAKTLKPARVMQELPVNVPNSKKEITNKVVKLETIKQEPEPVKLKDGKSEGVQRAHPKNKNPIQIKAEFPNVPRRILPKRKSAEKQQQQPEPMEISKHEVKIEDVEMEEIDTAPPLPFCTKRLLLVDDIDKDDEDDPQLVTEYVNQIYLYLRYLENEQYVEKDYLGNKKGGVILPKMRAVLIDWLVEVHQQFTMLQETLYLTVAILDRYLQKAAANVNRKSLQLVGVTAMFIASKYEEMYAPEIGDFVYITDSAYTQSQIRQQEIEILKVLNFDLGRPLPLHFLRRNSKAGCVDARVHTLAKYILELTILEYNLMHVAPSKLAAAALIISIKFFDDDLKKPLMAYWTDTLAYYTHYEWSDIAEVADELLVMVKKTCEARADAKLMAIRTKYSNKKFAKIAVVAQLKVDLFNLMRPAEFSTSSPK